MRRSGVLAGIIPLAICLPCLIPLLIVAGIGTGAFTAIGAWFSQPWIGVLGGAVAAGIVLAVGFALVVRRARTAACDSDVQQAARTSEG